MTFDTIAFTQDELDNALNLCCTSIGLCDNDFILPQIAGVTYISIGEISDTIYVVLFRFRKQTRILYQFTFAVFLDIARLLFKGQDTYIYDLSYLCIRTVLQVSA